MSVCSEKEIKRDESGNIVEIAGKPVYTISLPDWTVYYVEFSDIIEKVKLLLATAKLDLEDGEIRIMKITDKRIYFERNVE